MSEFPSPTGTSNGYRQVYAPGHPLAQRHGYVLEHRLVAHEAGIEIPPGSHVHHKNGDKADNRLSNLEVVPARDHLYLHNGKLTEAEVMAIRGSRQSQSVLAAAYGVAQQTISDIVNRKTWRHV